MKTLTLSIKSKKKVYGQVAKEFEKLRKGEYVKQKNELSFQNVNELRDFLTGKRIELLKEIRKEHPDSVYELGKITNRDLKSINTDLKILESYGLVKLVKTKDKRQRIVPKVEFDKIKIEIEI